MKKIFLAAASLLIGISAFATKEAFKTINSEELTKLMNGKNVYVYDANNQDTRAKEGLIPGAKTLSSYNKYDTKKELPAAKNSKLVFYCANTKCTASHDAANRAVKAGYKEVYVMSDGIQGWKSSGHTSEALKN